MSALGDVVHKQGVASFATLPSDSYEYRIDYEHAQGRVWLKSVTTEREWRCEIDNRSLFVEDPVYRDQFTMEITLLELALHYDPRVHKTETCKHVLLTRSRDDLVMQLSQRVYTRRNPTWGPTIQFTLAWVVGSGTLPHGLSRDPPAPPPPVEPPKPKLSRDEQQRELVARLRDENKTLKITNRDRADATRQSRTENDALRREVQTLKTTNDAQFAELLKLGSAHEFQRQHIEHLRRRIQDLQQQLAAANHQQPSHQQPSHQQPSAPRPLLQTATAAIPQQQEQPQTQQELQQQPTAVESAVPSAAPNKRRRVGRS